MELMSKVGTMGDVWGVGGGLRTARGSLKEGASRPPDGGAAGADGRPNHSAIEARRGGRRLQEGRRRGHGHDVLFQRPGLDGSRGEESPLRLLPLLALLLPVLLAGLLLCFFS